jgi:hypothetical protein
MALPTNTKVLMEVIKLLEENRDLWNTSYSYDFATDTFGDSQMGQIGSLFNVFGLGNAVYTETVSTDFLIQEGNKFIRCTKSAKGISWSVEIAQADMILGRNEFLRMEDGNYVYKRNNDTIFIDRANMVKI